MSRIKILSLPENNLKSGGKVNWIKGAVNPKHRGFCSPMSKSTCTPRRRAFAMTMKKHHGFHEDGGCVMCHGGKTMQRGGTTGWPPRDITDALEPMINLWEQQMDYQEPEEYTGEQQYQTALEQKAKRDELNYTTLPNKVNTNEHQGPISTEPENMVANRNRNYDVTDILGNIATATPAIYNLIQGLGKADTEDATKYYPRNKYTPQYKSYASALRRITPLYGSGNTNPYEKYMRANQLAKGVSEGMSQIDEYNAQQYDKYQQYRIHNEDTMRQADMYAKKYNAMSAAKQREFLGKSAEQISQLTQMGKREESMRQNDAMKIGLMKHMFPDVDSYITEDGDLSWRYSVNGKELTPEEKARNIRIFNMKYPEYKITLS